jgi:hypothetical protein
MKLYFIKSNRERLCLSDVDTEDEAIKIINQFLKDKNYTSYYMRSNKYDNHIQYDVGSWSEFFELHFEDGEVV